MKDVVLHVGFPKTGTTSIQGACGRTRDELAKEGISYPIFDLKVKANQEVAHQLPVLIALMRDPPERMASHSEPANRELAEVFDRFARSDDVRLILSHETLSQRSDVDFAKLRRLTDGHSLHVIAYVRLYDEWIESLYAQHVKDTRVVSKPFARSRISNIDTQRFLLTLREFENALPDAKITVRSYDRFRSGGLVEDFFDIAGIRRDARIDRMIAEGEERNVRQPSCQTMLTGYATFGLQDNAMSPKINSAFARALRLGAAIPFSGETFSFMPYATKVAARDSYRKDLPRLRRRFGLEADDPPPISIDTLDYKTGLTRSEFAELVEFVAPRLTGPERDRLAGAYDAAVAVIGSGERMRNRRRSSPPGKHDRRNAKGRRPFPDDGPA